MAVGRCSNDSHYCMFNDHRLTINIFYVFYIDAVASYNLKKLCLIKRNGEETVIHFKNYQLLTH